MYTYRLNISYNTLLCDRSEVEISNTSYRLNTIHNGFLLALLLLVEFIKCYANEALFKYTL